MTKQSIPPGYWEDANGNLIPEGKVREIDKVRDSVVRELFAKARPLNSELANFKVFALAEVAAFVSTSATQYDAKIGGEKGSVTLFTFDGRLKIQRAMQDTIAFGEGLQAAKALIDQCITQWSEGSNDNIKVLVSHAFQVDGKGEVSTSRVLGLRRLDIRDAAWLRAMQAISDSMQTVSSKAYLRFYQRDDGTGEYLPMKLDMAAV